MSDYDPDKPVVNDDPSQPPQAPPKNDYPANRSSNFSNLELKNNIRKIASRPSLHNIDPRKVHSSRHSNAELPLLPKVKSEIDFDDLAGEYFEKCKETGLMALGERSFEDDDRRASVASLQREFSEQVLQEKGKPITGRSNKVHPGNPPELTEWPRNCPTRPCSPLLTRQTSFSRPNCNDC
jgi:hypothetical protein